MTGTRIDFLSVDAARFNTLRDQWRSAASSCALSRSGLRVATVLPGFVNREFGYAFPTDEQLAAEIGADKKTAKRGLAALDEANLIERVTRPKHDDKGEVIGKARRIYLCLPTIRSERTSPRSEGTTSAEVKGQIRDGVKGQNLPEVKGQEVKGQPEVKGQKRVGEGSYGCPHIPDTNTPDQETRSGDRKVSVYERSAPSPVPSAVRNPYPTPKSWGTDLAFLDAFDIAVVDLTAQREIGAGEIERITQEAFDAATRATDSMPVYWIDVLAIRDSTMADWFRFRASALIHHREAA